MHYDNAIHMMEKQAGSFVKALAVCYYTADPDNRKILRIAFKKYFDEYQDRFLLYQKERINEVKP